MIEIRARLGGGRTSIEVSGHDEPAAGGRVCAAVSAITQTALLGLDQVAQQYPDHVSIEITEE
ncbi:ribosomal-processing cysteine protease Prp [Streptomyces mirabilis]|uniref:ribosomal-processing cysteine protease Prp n=1 Tax=Streptomyces mirabilis TaxID=68239 RepID=UPI0036B683E6